MPCHQKVFRQFLRAPLESLIIPNFYPVERLNEPDISVDRKLAFPAPPLIVRPLPGGHFLVLDGCRRLTSTQKQRVDPANKEKMPNYARCIVVNSTTRLSDIKIHLIANGHSLYSKDEFDFAQKKLCRVNPAAEFIRFQRITRSNLAIPRFFPKRQFEPSLDPLKDQISEYRGIIQPIIVRHLEDGEFLVLDGRRRLAAISHLCDEEARYVTMFRFIPCMVIESTSRASDLSLHLALNSHTPYAGEHTSFTLKHLELAA